MKSKAISTCAITVALSVLVLYLANIFDTLSVAMLVVTTCLMCLIVDLHGIKYALITYGATSILLFILLPNKFTAFFYFIAFGNYAIVKYFIEKLNNLKLEWIIKIIVANIYIFVCCLALRVFINLSLINVSIWGFIVVANVGFIICDYAISVLYSYFHTRFANLNFRRK